MAKPDFDPESHDDYAPNPVQLEFIRLAAEKYWYLALGDTEHAIPHIRAFMLNSKTVAALEQAGKNSYFLELDPAAQHYCDYLRHESKPGGIVIIDFEKIKAGREGMGGFWLDKPDADAIGNVFERSARAHKGVRFIPADVRMTDAAEFRRLAPQIDLALRLSEEYKTLKVKPELGLSLWERGRNSALSVCFRVAGKCNGKARGMIENFVNQGEETLMQALTHDQKTAAYVQSFDAPAAFSFGSGHFDVVHDDAQNPHLLGSLLRDEGKSLCVMNIYKDQAQRGGAEERSSDAELFVETDPQTPFGIKINNPDLQPLYEQALASVQAGRTFQLTTFQPLPS